jgi:DNA-binding transcriptional MerR regulator
MLQLNFWISELAAKTGVSTRTIRYYIEEGLLPQPEIQGKYAVFNDDYLFRLQLIKFLKDAYLPLREIRNRLDVMSSSQIEELVRRFEQDPNAALASLELSTPTRESNRSVNDDAQDYIRRVMQPKLDYIVNQPAPAKSALPSSPHQNANLTQGSWQRIEIIPGVELHIRQPVLSGLRRKVDELIVFARQLFNREV